MQAFGIALVWVALQVTILASAALLMGSLLQSSRRPSAGATFLSLLLVIVLTGAAFSPWPRWNWSLADQATMAGGPQAARAAQAERPAEHMVPPDSASVDADRQSPLMAAVSGFLDGLAHPRPLVTPSPEQHTWTWPEWVAVGFLGAFSLFAIRLATGWFSLQRSLQRARPIDDADLHRLVRELSAELGTGKSVQLYQSDEVVTAATVGWRRPLVLLPPGWEQWDAEECRMVLSHELAHVRAGDSVTWLIAQFTLLLHFYHPLVHCLVRRLRLEQELAADAVAARVSGGPNTYLITLAGMAVRQPERTVAWPVRPFLPARGTLMRRIEMLRDSKEQTDGFVERPPAWRRGSLVALTLVAGMLAAGIRPPAPATVQAAGPVAGNAARAADEAAPFNLQHFPRNTVMLAAFRPSLLAAKDDLQPLVKLIEDAIQAPKTGIRLSGIQQFSLMIVPNENGDRPAPPMFELRMAGPTDFSAYVRQQMGSVRSQTLDGAELLSAGDVTENPRADAIRILNETTLLQGPARVLANLDFDEKKFFPLRDAVQEMVTPGTGAIFALDVGFVRPKAQSEFERRPNPILGMVAPLWQNADMAVAGATVGKSPGVTIQTWSRQEAQAEKLQETVRMLIPAAKGMLMGAKGAAEQAPPDMKPLIQQGITMGENALNSATVERDGTRTVVSMQADGVGLATMTGLLLPAIQQAREAARRTQSANNLKQIMLALHNYHATYGHFPPPVLTGPDGKTRYSWRVAILPFIDQKDLYDQYNRDEPWDSENNKRVLAAKPRTLIHSSDDPDSTNTSYFAFVGGGTAFGNPEDGGTRIRDITDGTSNTVMVVEAKREIPWTKPEDLNYVMDEEIPKTGGWHPGGWHVALADGAVRFVSEAIDQGLWRRLLERNDGQVIEPF